MVKINKGSLKSNTSNDITFHLPNKYLKTCRQISMEHSLKEGNNLFRIYVRFKLE